MFSKTVPSVLNYFCFNLRWDLMFESPIVLLATAMHFKLHSVIIFTVFWDHIKYLSLPPHPQLINFVSP